MDNFTDPNLKLKYTKCRVKVKRWESEFRKKNGTIPSKDDIKEAPSEIREAYKWYWRLKIHALGQDSLLDATFEHDSSSTQNNSAFASAPGIAASNESDCKDNDASTATSVESKESCSASTKIFSEITHAVSCSDTLSGTCPDVDNTKTNNALLDQSSRKILSDIQNEVVESVPKEDNIPGLSAEEHQVAENKPSDLFSSQKEQTDTQETKPTDGVWGSHLNKPKTTGYKLGRSGLSRSSSFQLAEKLFVGSKVKMRNPRKSLSFSAGRFKEKSGTSTPDVVASPNISTSYSEEEKSTCLLDSQDDEDGFPVSSLIENVSSESKVEKIEEKFVIVKKSVTVSSQPLSAVHKLFEGNQLLHQKQERKVDLGWLERVSQVNKVTLQDQPSDLADSFLPNEDSTKKNHTNSKTTPDGSDDDFIYDSDTESNSPRKELKSRLALLPNVSVGTNMKVTNTIDSTLAVAGSKLDSSENPKKRKLDAIEAAMAVLSERRKADKETSRAAKKPRKSVPIKNTKNDVESNEEDEIIDGTKQATSKGSKMTKQELLEKKVSTGSVNDNFVRINLKKKVFVRGKKTMNFQKYKKQQWKSRKKANEADAAYISKMDPSDGAAGGGLQKCFKCGDVGHYARACLKMRGDSLLPNDEEETNESPFLTLVEVEKMANEKNESVHARLRARQKAEEENLRAANAVRDHHIPLVTPKVSSEEASDVQYEPEGNDENIDFVFDGDDDMLDMLKEPVHNPEINFGSVMPLYPTKQNGTVINTPPEVLECLNQFGHENFRPGQEVAIMRILSGLSTLVTLSTGSGKSLCYQLPAYLYACRSKCITLVVSPLVSLMDDQVTGLPSFIRAAALHTGQTQKQRETVMEMVKAGKLQILLVSPEAIVAGEKRTGFGSLLRELPDIAFACVDEAHCVSQWSHNFRPSYLMICKVLREKLGVRTVLALTATATQPTVRSIIDHLSIPDGLQGVIQDIPLPNNLLLTVSHDVDRDRSLVGLLKTPDFCKYESIIIYCTRREECERLAALLRTCLQNSNRPEDTSKRRKVSLNAEAYHAGLSSTKRKQIQKGFMSGELRVVVATVAFGMGINKSNIRSVIHFNMPQNFESYVQEVGRAGRDGKSSHCHLFLNSEGKDLSELKRHIYSDSVDRHAIRKLLQRVFVPCKCKEKTEATGVDERCAEEVPNKEGEADSLNSEGKSKIIDNIQIKEQPCTGHEVAFSVEETVAALDLPEENITTLLCYLELHHKKLIKVLPKAYTVCKIQSYRGMKHIRVVARSCPPLAMAIAQDIMNGVSHKNTHTLEFQVVEIASAIGWDSGIVKRELMNLEWTKVNNQPRRSGIKVEFLNLGFRVRAPGNLSSEELDSALDFLHQRVDNQERSALCQLQAIFNALTSVSYRDIRSLDEALDVDLRCEKLKAVVRTYFKQENIVTEDYQPEVKLKNREQIASDIRQLVNMYRDCSFTGRAVARIFHGINSPNFPAHVWGRCRFWRAHLDSDFKLICLLATQVLLKMR